MGQVVFYYGSVKVFVFVVVVVYVEDVVFGIVGQVGVFCECVGVVFCSIQKSEDIDGDFLVG